jgi:hypothetical protein
LPWATPTTKAPLLGRLWAAKVIFMESPRYEGVYPGIGGWVSRHGRR